MNRRELESGDELQFLVFRLGGREFALGISQAERILRYEASGVAAAAGLDFLDGRVPFGGGAVPLLDLRRRAGIAAMEREETRIVVLAIEAVPLAIVVDQVTEVIRVDTRMIRPVEQPVPGFPAECLGGLITRGDRGIVILNAARLLSRAERQALTEART